jgi:hypothetical protein
MVLGLLLLSYINIYLSITFKLYKYIFIYFIIKILVIKFSFDIKLEILKDKQHRIQEPVDAPRIGFGHRKVYLL